MAGFYYTQSGYPLYNSQASSALEKAEFLSVQAGFDKLPTPTGFPNALVKVKADQSGLDLSTATISSTGALAGITGMTSASGAWDLTGVTSFRVPTATPGDSSTKAASTAFVAASFAPLASPVLTGVPLAPTAVAGTNTDQIATTAFVTNQVLTATLPGQAGNSGKFLTTNGSSASWAAAQAPLVSGTNIKTVNGNSLLGSGDVTIASSGGDVVGPAASVDSELVLFSGTTGKLVKRSASSGLVKLTAGVVGTATAGTDFQAAITATGLLKGAGAGSVSAATAGTDYLAPPSGTALLKANAGGALANATANTDYLIPALANTAVTGFKTATFNGQVNNASTSGAVTVNWTNGQVQSQAAPSGAITYTFTAPPGVCHLQLLIAAPTTAQTINWPAAVIWLETTWAGVNNKAAVINFWYDGTNYYAIGSNQV